MEKMSGVDLHTEASEGGLKELVLRWFTETQAPLLLTNGNFPDWFRGFAARKDAEELLRDKALGCFLIRLSDKAIGYILSYRGHDRCRHFVISQDQGGQFVVSGDCQTYGSLTELIQHYRLHPIQPFGEHLTSSCHEVNSAELYDVVNFSSRECSGVSVQALRTLWDQKNPPGRNHLTEPQSDPPPPPALPPKSRNRKLTGAVSMDNTSLSQGVPPVPKRGLAQGFSPSGSLPHTTSHPGGTRSALTRSEGLGGNSHLDSLNTADTACPGDLCPAGTTYSELTHVESRSRSLPRLNVEEEEEELASSSSSSSPPAPLKKITCHTYSLHEPRPSSSESERHADDEEMSRNNPLYQHAERPPENTYELIPGGGNTYESLEDMKTKKSKSTLGKNNMNWKKFLPDYMKK